MPAAVATLETVVARLRRGEDGCFGVVGGLGSVGRGAMGVGGCAGGGKEESPEGFAGVAIVEGFWLRWWNWRPIALYEVGIADVEGDCCTGDRIAMWLPDSARVAMAMQDKVGYGRTILIQASLSLGCGECNRR